MKIYDRIIGIFAVYIIFICSVIPNFKPFYFAIFMVF
jgi:hypothetical protein